MIQQRSKCNIDHEKKTIFVEMHFLIYLSESFLYHLTFLGPVIKTMKVISL